MMSKVTIYTKEGCPYCAAAKKHYTEQGVTFDEIDVNAEAGAKEKVLDLTKGQRIVPVIVEGDDIKIGFGGG
ncbi:MAG: glutaredoxin family protein [candidate division Zixibacteria bacterium]|nr:glutaredoxin family protein [candidate division Zixibacteria bacterium]